MNGTVLVFSMFAAPAPSPAIQPPPSFSMLAPVSSGGIFANYDDAYRIALKTRRPLLRWVNVECERCIAQSQDEFVHQRLDSFEGSNTPRVIVSIPKGGELERIGEVTWWITGDATFGHLPSSRRLIRQHQRSGKYEVISAPPVMNWAPPPPVMMAPQIQRVPMMRFSSPAACST